MLAPWGEVPWLIMRKLEQEKGITIRLFEYPERKFDKTWVDDFPLEIINKQNGKLYFVVYHETEEKALPLVPLVLPKKSSEEIQSFLKRLESRLDEINKTLDEYATLYSKPLEDRIVAAKDELSLKLAHSNKENLLEDQIVLMEVWCPKTQKEKLETYSATKALLFTESEPEEGETPPVLLKNNKFSKLFEPIGNLFSLPAYAELDLTVYFAPFFLLFFGFCLGDTGYGLVILLACTIIKPRVSESTKPFLILGQLFGLSTLVIGFFSGTLFGLEMVKIEAFSSFKYLFISQENMFYVALGIGFIQIIFGMCVQVYKQVKFFGWLYAINRIGWIIGLLALIDIAILKQFTSISTVVIIVAASMVVLFGSPKDGPLKSIGLGLADLYNITGVAGDLLSYIRLFALGVSSAILGLVVNSIAMSAGGVPYVGIFLTILILVVGHTANLMLASLSAFVHPMRLTFVEFYKNVGFLGGGKPFKTFQKKYQPLKNQNKQE
jgi:V/A-type H+-transporting ATPase subunit I